MIDPATLEPLRVSLRLHWRVALALGGAVLVVAFLAAWATPRSWRVDAELLVSEPVAMHRLANPFAPVPRQREELEQLPELLTSRVRLVALIKRNDLLDKWNVARPWPLLFKDRLQQAVLGPTTDQDRLEALVVMLERRVNVTVTGSKVQLGVEWPDPELALEIVRSMVASLQDQREAREVKALEEAASALDEQLAGIRVELRSRVQRMDATMAALRAGGSSSSLDADNEQLDRDRERAAELMVLAEDKHISADVMHRANALRFIALKPPRLPTEDQGPALRSVLASTVLGVLLTGLVAALGLGVLGGRVLSGRGLTRALSLPVLASLGSGAAGDSPTKGPGRWQLAAAVGLAVGTGVALGASRGSLAMTALPTLAALGCYLLWRLPPRWPMLTLFLLAVTIDNPTDKPYNGLWRSPLYPLGKLLYSNVAWFTGFELAVMALGLVWALKTWLEVPGGNPVSPPRVLRFAVWVSAATVAGLVAWGLLKGGNFRDALWQMRNLLLVPPVTALAFWALEFPRDLPALAKVLAVGSVVKAFLGWWFVYAVITSAGVAPPHTTGHNDTMIFVSAALVAVLLLWERPTQRHLALALLWLPVVFLAIKLNDRRIAYIDLFFGLAFVYAVSPWHWRKRGIARTAVLLALPVALYLAAGWNVRYGSLFAPVQVVRSLVSPDEDSHAGTSSVERDIENYDIVRSWQENMLLGQGFGHHFTEWQPTFDFAQSGFGLIGHNSVLWLWWIGGPLGFTGVLAFLVVAIYLLRRSLSAATAWADRAALFTALSILVTYLVQGFGDMGFCSGQSVFFVAVAVAIAGHYATTLGVLRPIARPILRPRSREFAIQV